MKTLKEKFDEIVKGIGTDYMASNEVVEDLVKSVQEYNKEVRGENMTKFGRKINLTGQDITHPENLWIEGYNWRAEEIKEKQEELLG